MIVLDTYDAHPYLFGKFRVLSYCILTVTYSSHALRHFPSLRFYRYVNPCPHFILAVGHLGPGASQVLGGLRGQFFDWW